MSSLQLVPPPSEGSVVVFNRDLGQGLIKVVSGQLLPFSPSKFWSLTDQYPSEGDYVRVHFAADGSIASFVAVSPEEADRPKLTWLEVLVLDTEMV